MEALYICTKKSESISSDPFNYLYLLYKVHKPTISTRAICSACGGVTFALGQYVDEKLQPIAQAQPSYFKDSFALKDKLQQLKLPANALLCTYDAVSMYTDIDTTHCLEVLSTHLRKPALRMKFGYDSTTLIAALEIILRGNVMKFGDLFAEQIKGITMGLCPAPPIANLYVALTQEAITIPAYADCVKEQLRFIDDGICTWLTHPDPATNTQRWHAFKSDMNNHGLQWIFSEPSRTIVFMDMTISIDENGTVITDLYKKPLALYLYIPPKSAHAPGVCKGLVFGQLLRIFYLCSRLPDIQRHIKDFYDHLKNRGYSHNDILPIFERAAEHAENFLLLTPDNKKQKREQKKHSNARKLFLHLPYHPHDPPSSILQ